MAKTLSPKQARTIDQVCLLNRDNTDAGDFWLLTDGYDVTICHQRAGESPVGQVTIPREQFAKLINWYQRPQKIKPRRIAAAPKLAGEDNP